jgi:hypothetical protein
MRRVLLVLLVLVMVLPALLARRPRGLAPLPSSAPHPTHQTAPVVRLRRGSEPVRSHEALPSPAAPASPVPAPTSALPAPTEATEPTELPPRTLSLDSLDPAARDALTHAALAHLHELAEACESTVSGSEDLGAFVTLDHDGVLELDIQPIARDSGPIAVEDRSLSPALVDCLDDALWAQDWSAAGPAVPEGAELPIALTMRLNR